MSLESALFTIGNVILISTESSSIGDNLNIIYLNYSNL